MKEIAEYVKYVDTHLGFCNYLGDYREKNKINKIKCRLTNEPPGKPEGERTRGKKKNFFFKAAPLNARTENHLREPANEGNLSSWRR